MKKFTPKQLEAMADPSAITDAIVSKVCGITARSLIQEYADCCGASIEASGNTLTGSTAGLPSAVKHMGLPACILVPLAMAAHAGLLTGRNNFIQAANGEWIRLKPDDVKDLALCCDPFKRPLKYRGEETQ